MVRLYGVEGRGGEEEELGMFSIFIVFFFFFEMRR